MIKKTISVPLGERKLIKILYEASLELPDEIQDILYKISSKL